MHQLSISQFCSRRWTFFQDVVRYSSWGIYQIGVWREKLAELELDEAIDLLDEMNLSVSSLSWAGGFTGSNGLGFDEAVEDARRAIETAHMLRAGCLVVHPGANNGHTDRHLRRLIRDALDVLVPYADDYGVRLAIEPTLALSRSPWNFLTTFDEHLTLVESYSPQNLGLVLDLYHLGDREQLMESLPQLIERVALVQLADFSTHGQFEKRLCPGQGAVPFQRWLDALGDAGYQGPLELEIHGRNLTPDQYGSALNVSLNYLRQNTTSPYSSAPRSRRDPST